MSECVGRKLGRLPYRHDARTVRLVDYTTAALPPPPPSRLWQTPVRHWGMAGNDEYGDCVFATAAHAILSWRANASQNAAPIADRAVIQLARRWGGLDGYNILDRNKRWRKEEMWANRLGGFAGLVPENIDLVKSVINEFGVADVGLNLPDAWLTEDDWIHGVGPRYRPNRNNGHSVPLVGYDAEWLYAVSWDAIHRIEIRAFPPACDEAYALFDRGWLMAGGSAPPGFDVGRLEADIAALAA